MALMNWRTEDVGLFDVNFDTGERYWSRELRQLLAVPRDVPAAFDLLLRRVHPEDRRAFALQAMEAFRPDCPMHAVGEFRIVAGDGEVRWVHAERVTIFRPTAEHDVVRIAGFMAEIAEPIRPFETSAIWTGFGAMNRCIGTEKANSYV